METKPLKCLETLMILGSISYVILLEVRFITNNACQTMIIFLMLDQLYLKFSLICGYKAYNASGSKLNLFINLLFLNLPCKYANCLAF